MKRSFTRIATAGALAAALAFAAACSNPAGSTAGGGGGGNGGSAPTTLFSDPGLTFSANPTKEMAMVQDMGNPSATTTASTTIPATGTFQSYPAWWDGAIAWATKPAGSTGYYDLSGVKTIKFKIKSSTILPTQLALFIQWKSATGGMGNEYTIPLATSSSVTDPSGATANLSVTSITDWTNVAFDLTTLPDSASTHTGEPVRNAFTAENFFAANGGDGATHVDTPFAIKWYGSAGKSPNSGPLAANASYQIGDIQFLDASNNPVAIYSGIQYLGPTNLAAAPTMAAGSVSSLFNSSGTYTDYNSPNGLGNWNPGWGQGGSISAVTVAGKSIKLMNLVNYQGIDISGPNGAPADSAPAPLNASGMTYLHISYWTPDSTALSVDVINATTDTFAQAGATVTFASLAKGAWTDLEVPMPAGFDMTTLRQIKFTNESVAGSNSFGAAANIYLDNIYFHN
jgi:hypothetical protein